MARAYRKGNVVRVARSAAAETAFIFDGWVLEPGYTPEADTRRHVEVGELATLGTFHVATGMVADGQGADIFGSIYTGTDNAAALTASIAAAQATGKTLFIPPGVYRIASTVTITGKVNISARGVRLLADIRSKTAPALKLVGVAEGMIDGLHIWGAGWLTLAGIQFADVDSQFCTLRSVRVQGCRHGVYINEAEVANRIVLDSCTLISNLIAGFYLHSFEAGQAYGQSGPIILRDTIVHANGIPGGGWFTASTTYGGVAVLSAGDKATWQVYAKGFVNFQIRGGQISGPGVRNASLAHFETGGGVVLYGVDVEDFAAPLDASTGTVLADRATLRSTPNDGAALTFLAVQGIAVRDFHIWKIEAPTVIKLAYHCKDVVVEGLHWWPQTPADTPYLVDVVGANYAPADASNSNIVRLWYSGDPQQLTLDAWAAFMGKSSVRTVVDWSRLRPVDNQNVHFDHLYAKDDATDQYLIGYMGANLSAPNWSSVNYSDFKVSPGSTLHWAMAGVINTYTPDGRLIFGFFDGAGALISTATSITSTQVPATGGPDTVYVRHGRVEVPANTRTVRIGFGNSGNYTGNWPSHVGLTSLTVWEAGAAPLAATALRQVDADENRLLDTKVGSETVNNIVQITETAYAALATKDPGTLYVRTAG